MEYICKCNNCDNLYIDTNPQVGAKKYDVDYLNLDDLYDHKCPKCKVDDYLDDSVYRKLWNILGDIPCDEEEEIEEEFLHFGIGTDKYEIWHWFEETFDIVLGEEFF